MPGLASLLRGRTTNPRAGGAAARRMHTLRKLKRNPMGYETPVPFGTVGGIGGTGPPGGKTGGVVGYQRGGRTVNPRAAAMRRNRPIPATAAERLTMAPIPMPNPRGWQEGGPVGVSPEEVDMASDIYARAAPEQQAQITGGGGGPGMMDEEAAIGEALAMAMGGGGGGPPMNGGPPMGGMI